MRLSLPKDQDLWKLRPEEAKCYASSCPEQLSSREPSAHRLLTPVTMATSVPCSL